MHRLLGVLIVGSLFLTPAGATATPPSPDVPSGPQPPPLEGPAVPASAALDLAAADPVRVLTRAFDDVALALDRSGRRHVVGASRKGDLWYATDRSGAWQRRLLRAGGYPGWGWRQPSVATDADGSVHVVAARWSLFDAPSSTAGVWYLTDAGRAPGDFARPIKITRNMTSDPSLRVVDGILYLAYAECACSPGDTRQRLYLKTGTPGAWRTEQVSAHGRLPSLRVDPAGRARLVFADRRGLRYAKARTATGPVGTPDRVPGTVGRCEASALALDSAGRPVVACVSWKGVWFLRRTADGWSPPRKLGSGHQVDMSIDASDRPHVAFDHGDADGRVMHRWLEGVAWRSEVVGDDVDSSGVAIRTFGDGVTVAYAQTNSDRGIWVADR